MTDAEIAYVISALKKQFDVGEFGDVRLLSYEALPRLGGEGFTSKSGCLKLKWSVNDCMPEVIFYKVSARAYE